VETAVVRIAQDQKRQRRAYVCFLICGACLLVNTFAYLPAKDFTGAEAIEFLVTIPLIPIFLVSALAGTIYAVRLGLSKNKPLLLLVLFTVCFVVLAYFRGDMSRQISQTVYVTYAGTATVLSLLGLAVGMRQGT
jgi:hypothetical protein